MCWLKADLHVHTREGEFFIAFDAYRLVERAAQGGFHVLSITNHVTVTFSEHLGAGQPPWPTAM